MPRYRRSHSKSESESELELEEASLKMKDLRFGDPVPSLMMESESEEASVIMEYPRFGDPVPSPAPVPVLYDCYDPSIPFETPFMLASPIFVDVFRHGPIITPSDYWPGVAKVGDKFDFECRLIHPLRNFLFQPGNRTAVRIKRLRGRFVAICCLPNPVRPGSFTDIVLHNFLYAFHYYSHHPAYRFQLIIVSMYTDDSFYLNFLKKSGPHTLVIPNWDRQARLDLCQFIGISTDIDAGFLLVGPDKKVLLSNSDIFVFRKFGPTCYPFTRDRWRELREEQYEWPNKLGVQKEDSIWIRYGEYVHDERWITALSTVPPSLEEIMDLGPITLLADVCGVKESILFSTLARKKLVGLYLCYDGKLMKYLKHMNVRCEAQGLDPLEIILVHIPFDHSDLWKFVDGINEAVKDLNLSCWALPTFDGILNHRFWMMFSMRQKDMLITFDGERRDANRLELNAGEMVYHYGFAAYPFSIAAMVESEVVRLRALTIESLLTFSPEDNYVIRGNTGDIVPLASLRGKNVILYMDYLEKGYGDIGARGSAMAYLVDLYNRHENLEVVFIPLDKRSEIYECDPYYTAMPWLLCPFHLVHSTSVINQLFFEGNPGVTSLVGFGEDGRIRSIDLSHYNSVLPLPDNLHWELGSAIESSLQTASL